MSFIFLWVKKRLIYRQCFRPHFYEKNAMNNLETCHLGMKMKKNMKNGKCPCECDGKSNIQA